MYLLLIGLIIFFIIHFLPSLTSTRQAIVSSIGQLTYTVLFSLFSILGIIFIAYGYGELKADGSANSILWWYDGPPKWMKHIVFLLMMSSFIFLAAAYIPSRIRDTLRHPMLVAIKIWAFSHLLVNGDLASAILFGSFLAYAVIDRIAIKRRAAAGIQSRGPLGDRIGGLAGDIAAIAIGLAAYAFMLFIGHQWLIGVALIDR